MHSGPQILSDSPTSTTALGRPRKSEEQERANNILAHALSEFCAHGFVGASIEAIARKAGVGKATIYKKYQNKEGLFRAVGQYANTPVQHRISKVQTVNSSVENVLIDFARSMTYQQDDLSAFNLIRLAIFEQVRFPEIAEAIYMAGLETLSPLKNYFITLIEQGHLKADDPDEMLILFCSLVTKGHGFLLTQPSSPHAHEAHLRRTVGLFLNGNQPID